MCTAEISLFSKTCSRLSAAMGMPALWANWRARSGLLPTTAATSTFPKRRTSSKELFYTHKENNPTMKTIKTAIVGTGFMGKVHTENVRRLGNVEVAAVVGSKPERARQFAQSAGIPIAAESLEQVLENKEISAVHICTPNADHYPMSLAAIEAGKAVLCEKPLTMNVEEARKLVAAAEKRKAIHCVQHNLRYYPVVQQIRDMIA